MSFEPARITIPTGHCREPSKCPIGWGDHPISFGSKKPPPRHPTSVQPDSTGETDQPPVRPFQMNERSVRYTGGSVTVRDRQAMPDLSCVRAARFDPNIVGAGRVWQLQTACDMPPAAVIAPRLDKWLRWEHVIPC